MFQQKPKLHCHSPISPTVKCFCPPPACSSPSPEHLLLPVVCGLVREPDNKVVATLWVLLPKPPPFCRRAADGCRTTNTSLTHLSPTRKRHAGHAKLTRVMRCTNRNTSVESPPLEGLSLAWCPLLNQFRKTKYPPSPPCISYGLVQATAGLGERLGDHGVVGGGDGFPAAGSS